MAKKKSACGAREVGRNGRTSYRPFKGVQTPLGPIMEFVPAAPEKDTCHVGQGLHTLLTRMTSAREGETFEPNDMLNQHGFKEGTWNAPTA